MTATLKNPVIEAETPEGLPVYKGCIIDLGRKSFNWDSTDPKTVTKAQAIFADIRAAGGAIYATRTVEGKSVNELVQRGSNFDPSVEAYTATQALVGG